MGFAKVIADNVKGDGIDVSDPTTGELRVRSVGDRVAASRISLQLEDDGDSVDVSVDLVLMLQGRTINQLATVDLLTTFDEDLRAKLLTRAAELVEQAQGSS